MRVVFALMGETNLATEICAAVLKEKGHEAYAVFDPALFAERLYFNIPWLARLFSQEKKVVQKILAYRPDLLAISSFSDNYLWTLEIARAVKKELDIPVVVGGVHPTSVPDVVIQEDCVDFVCVGDGEEALVELVECLGKGYIDYTIENLWFKNHLGEVIQAPRRRLANVQLYPPYDKTIVENDIVVKNMYHIVATRGCPYRCRFCSMEVMGNQNGGPDLRRRTVEQFIEELEWAKNRYGVKLFDIEDAVLTADRKWFREFAKQYAKRIGVPYIAQSYPANIDEEVAFLLKESGCYRLQIGIQSFSENVRKTLNRMESNARIIQAFDALEKAGVRYATDYIFGIPGETDETSMREFALVLAERKYVYKVHCFWLTCFPRTTLVDLALKHNLITERDVYEIERGRQAFYYNYGITKDPHKRRRLRIYTFLFRISPLLNRKWMERILDSKPLCALLSILPKTPILFVIDMYMFWREKDPVSGHLWGEYVHWLKRIIFGKGVYYDFEEIRERYRGYTPRTMKQIYEAEAKRFKEDPASLVRGTDTTPKYLTKEDVREVRERTEKESHLARRLFQSRASIPG